MKLLPRLTPLFAFGILLLAGCGSSSTAIQPIHNASATAMGGDSAAPAKYVAGNFDAGKTEIPSHILNAVAGHLNAELRKRNVGGEGVEGALRIDATTTYYRMRSGFSRMMAGALAGKDGIKCDVQIVDPASNQPVGKFEVSSYNIMAVGGEDDIARMLATEIAKALEAYKK